MQIDEKNDEMTTSSDTTSPKTADVVDNQPPKSRKQSRSFRLFFCSHVCLVDGKVAVSKTLAIVLCVVLLCSLILASVGLGLYLTDRNSSHFVYNKANNSVVIVNCFNASGVNISVASGFFIAEDVVATCFHVIENCSSITITAYDQTVLEVRQVVGYDKDKDIVLLKTEHAEGFKPLTVDKNTYTPGEKIYLLGNPVGYSHTFSEGMISAFRSQGASSLYQISAPLSAGSSGSPLLNSQGNVIGMALSIETAGSNIGMALPSQYFTLDAQNIDIDDFIYQITPSIADNLYYSDNGDGTVTITGIKSKITRSIIKIPAWIKNRQVTAVALDATSSTFLNNVSTIIIEEGITQIKTNCFLNADKLTTLYLPSTLTHMDADALACRNLKQVAFDNGSEYFVLKDGVLFDKDYKTLYYYGKDLTQSTYRVPQTVEIIASGAFYDNDYVKEFYLPQSLVMIGYEYATDFQTVGAFEECSNLSNVYFHTQSKPLIIGNRSFVRCLSMGQIYLPSSLVALGSYSFYNSGVEKIIFNGDKLPNMSTYTFGSRGLGMYCTQKAFDDAKTRSDITQFGFEFFVEK